MRYPATVLGVAAALALGAACQQRSDNWSATSATPECRPVDGAWAAAVQVKDAVTGKPVARAGMWVSSFAPMAPTDSSGWSCIRTFAPGEETVHVDRPGYRSDSIALRGVLGQVVTRELRFHRVRAPCCDLRGQWQITFRLESAADFGPKPTARTVEGAVDLGPRFHPPQADDDLDSLVRIVRGMHRVDFHPFFGGPVARDVSTTVIGGGPDLFREVMARIPEGDRVEITFIPRMSHGSLSLDGRIRSDTIRGDWMQNAYCCGARGTFVMTRTAPPDTTPFPNTARALESEGTRGRLPSATTPPGRIPGGRWRPELAVAPGGRLWLARAGLFVADSAHGAWRRVLGGPTDPVEADELRTGLHITFVTGDTVLIGMGQRYPMEGAPVLYRTENGGATWAPVTVPNVRAVDGLSAIGRSVWIAATRNDHTSGLFTSTDGGKTWTDAHLPAAVRNIVGLHRPSDSLAFLYSANDPSAPALWRTLDGGRRWTPIPTPYDEGLQKLDPSSSRVEQLATVGEWLLLREHGRVFVTPINTIRWRPLPDLTDIAPDPAGKRVFALRDSLVPALLDEDLNNLWPGAHALELATYSYLEQLVFRNSIGYVTEGHGSIHEIRDGRARVVRSARS
ncbi:MAG TPA: hypothetical protein VJ650_04855, partial [Gemmatimonadaceae bacterium]|nr:hypothetical protein [Gemmatimonadaceae bacterium]